MNLFCRTILFDSDEQLKSMDLRREILRKPLGLDFTPEDLAGEEDQIHIGCFIDAEIAGILLLKSAGPDEIKMRQVAVTNHLQGQGIGKAMVRFAEQWALDNGYFTMTLHARETAVPFYLQLGYSIQGDKFTEVGIPHFKMLKKLQYQTGIL